MLGNMNSSLGYTNGDLGSVSSDVDQFIDIFDPKRKSTKPTAFVEPNVPTAPSTPVYQPAPDYDTTQPPVVAPVSPSVPSVMTAQPVPSFDKFIEAISPIKIQFVTPLEIKTSGVSGVANDPSKPSVITPISAQTDTSQPITIYTIDKTPSNPNAVSEKDKDRALWEKWQWIGLAVAVTIPLMTVLLTWMLNSKKSSRRRNKRRR